MKTWTTRDYIKIVTQESYQNPTNEELAWVAGIIDGEGYIRIARRIFIPKSLPNSKVYYRLEVFVGMVHKPSIEKLQSIFNKGKIKIVTPDKNKNHVRVVWRWILSQYESVDVLKFILPYLITKKDEALVALEFAKLNDKRGRKIKKLTQEDWNAKDSLFIKIKELKHLEFIA